MAKVAPLAADGAVYNNAAAVFNARYGGLSNNGANTAGTAVNIAVVSYVPWNPSDWDTWYSIEVANHLLPAGARRPITLGINGVTATTTGPSSNSIGQQELDLDTQTITAISPQAQIYVMVSSSTRDMFDNLALNSQSHAFQVISYSWDSCDWPHGDPTNADAENADINAINNAGVPFFAASGDNGTTCDDGTNTYANMVGFPAMHPDVISVGGTQEVPGQVTQAWEHASSSGAVTEGAGGGFSLYGAPSYQSALGYTYRAVADVSANASELSAPDVYMGGGNWRVGDGTSEATPMWAALTAQIFASLTAPGQLYVAWPSTSMLGWLYGHAEALNDVTSGGNSALPTWTGWDFPTGLGTPNVPMLMRELGGAYGGDLSSVSTSPVSSTPVNTGAPTRPVAVHHSVTSRTLHSAIPLHHLRAVYVTVSPAKATRVWAYVYRNHAWHRSGSFVTKANGRLTLIFSGTHRGSDRWKFYLPAYRTYSASFVLTVR